MLLRSSSNLSRDLCRRPKPVYTRVKVSEANLKRQSLDPFPPRGDLHNIHEQAFAKLVFNVQVGIAVPQALHPAAVRANLCSSDFSGNIACFLRANQHAIAHKPDNR